MNKIGLDLDLAANILKDGGIVAFPTETVMGLGVVFDNYEAYQRLNVVKGRPESKPYTMMLSSINDVNKYAQVSNSTLKIINKFMPGPLTILLKAKDNVPGYVTHNTGIIGIRIPNHPLLLDLLKRVGKPLLVPSANPSGLPPATKSAQIPIYFKDCLEYIIDSDSAGEQPSTIVDLTFETPKLVREGKISLSNIIDTIKG